MLNTASHQGNANQNHKEISHHTCLAIIKMNTNKCQQERAEKQTLLHCWWESTVENIFKSPQKTKIKLTIWPSNYTPGYKSEEN